MEWKERSCMREREGYPFRRSQRKGWNKNSDEEGRGRENPAEEENVSGFSLQGIKGNQHSTLLLKFILF